MSDVLKSPESTTAWDAPLAKTLSIWTVLADCCDGWWNSLTKTELTRMGCFDGKL